MLRFVFGHQPSGVEEIEFMGAVERIWPFATTPYQLQGLAPSGVGGKPEGGEFRLINNLTRRDSSAQTAPTMFR